MIKFILKIKEIRIMKNMTQSELAKKSGVDQSYISILESINRKKSPTLKTLEGIGNALDICPLKLVECSCKNCKNKSME